MGVRKGTRNKGNLGRKGNDGVFEVLAELIGIHAYHHR
jgi:hypothetical protein